MLFAYLTNLIPTSLRPYAKFVAPAFAGVIATVIRTATTGALDAPELEITIVGFLAATASFVVTNAPSGVASYLKAIVPGVLTAAAVAVHYLVTGSWDQAEWTLAITGFGATLITLLLPNGTEPLLAVPRAAEAPTTNTTGTSTTPVVTQAPPAGQ